MLLALLLLSGPLAAPLALAAPAADVTADPRVPRVSPQPRVLHGVIDSRTAGPQHVVAIVPPGPPGARYPAVLVFSGLGEAREGREASAWAWVARYGAVEAMSSLAGGPSTGVILVCSSTPVWFVRDARTTPPFERYVLDELLPWAEANLPLRAEEPRWGIDGLSLGGIHSTYLGFSHPDRFSAIGSLQGAVARVEETIHRLARRNLARLKKRVIRIGTSRGDGFRESLTSFHAWLDRIGLPHRFVVLPGRHDYEFVQGPGVRELLSFHAEVLGGAGPEKGGRLP